MPRNVVETVLGAVVLVVAVGFFVWAYTRTSVGGSGGYELVAKFDRADGLDPGSDVRIAGVKVGSVTGTSLDPQTYRAAVRFDVRDNIQLPTDSSASIVSASLLGGKYLSLTPGGDEEMLKPGGEITLTQGSVNLEDLIGKYIFSSQGGSPGQAGGAAKPPQPGAPAGAAPQQ